MILRANRLATIPGVSTRSDAQPRAAADAPKRAAERER